jgi:hypothetical protein
VAKVLGGSSSPSAQHPQTLRRHLRAHSEPGDAVQRQKPFDPID